MHISLAACHFLNVCVSSAIYPTSFLCCWCCAPPEGNGKSVLLVFYRRCQGKNAIAEQFRRKGNVYFLIMGCLMAIGEYGTYFEAAFSPWTTLGPLAIVIAISLIQEGVADFSRHASDRRTNRFKCTILNRILEDDEKREKTRMEKLLGCLNRKDNFPLDPNDLVLAVDTEIATNENDLADIETNTKKQTKIKFQTVQRQQIRAGNLVFLRNRDMIPADLVLLASSGDNGGAYIETSSIDGETNLKLRTRARPSSTMLSNIREGKQGIEGVLQSSEAKQPQERKSSVSFGTESPSRGSRIENGESRLNGNEPIEKANLQSSEEALYTNGSNIHRQASLKLNLKYSSPTRMGEKAISPNNRSESISLPAIETNVASAVGRNEIETLEQATARIASTTILGHPFGISALECTNTTNKTDSFRYNAMDDIKQSSSFTRLKDFASSSSKNSASLISQPCNTEKKYISMLTCELPNASVNTFSGKMTLCPVKPGSPPIEISLNADNFLLRGAFLRNTEWAIGLASFTGSDTKLVQNSFHTPSKFSQLDQLVNRVIMIIVVLMMIIVFSLSLLAFGANYIYFDHLWYVGYNSNTGMKWPYFADDLPPPNWEVKSATVFQNMFFYITLLNNYVPLSLYITLEIGTRVLMWYINNDLDMWHQKTDTPAAARSTTVTDLGQIKYIFSDKTGTLTQNVMRFKRCSVDGMMFGAPVVKSAPESARRNYPDREQEIFGDSSPHPPSQAFHPLKKLLLRADLPLSENKTIVNETKSVEDDGLGDGLAPLQNISTPTEQNFTLTFNAEMYLRVMSICHTVVVEKDHDKAQDSTSDHAKSKGLNKILKWSAGHKQASNVSDSSLTESNKTKTDNEKMVKRLTKKVPDERQLSNQYTSVISSADEAKSRDGAPIGKSYQAESPDEGALVSAASLVYGFQLLSNDSNGVRLNISSPSVLQSSSLVEGLRRESITPKLLAAKSASPGWYDYLDSLDDHQIHNDNIAGSDFSNNSREEIWQVLAVNKFDSTRKRMSVLVRSPPELGSIPMLLCKGADSAMLDGVVCESGHDFPPHNENDADISNADETEWEITSHLAIQTHLGDFASEGLRTLVLGVRFLTERDCADWLQSYTAAAASITKRDKKLTQAALDIERGLHIVGVTAIEDKLQQGVPSAISNLAAAGIKLWVLTGDKRETAIEIGYSTKVLTPEMNLHQVTSDGIGATRARTIVANQFMRLVKTGELAQYQKAQLEKKAESTALNLFCIYWRKGGKWWKKLWVLIWSILLFPCRQTCWKNRRMLSALTLAEGDAEDGVEVGDDPQKAILQPAQRRKAVRKLAEGILLDYIDSENTHRGAAAKHQPMNSISGSSSGMEDEEGNPPAVFRRATDAKAVLEKHRHERGMSAISLRSLSMASSSCPSNPHTALVDEDIVSMLSFFPDGTATETFDKKKRTILERLFAVDSDVRHGRLGKHLKSEKHMSLDSRNESNPSIEVLAGVAESIRAHNNGQGGNVKKDAVGNQAAQGPRALIIEGSALSHLLGNPLLEEMLFAVASTCEVVIACRVSPKQKALLVKMVRTCASPAPMTLAIGDGANDVGMIQEAHVGVGISGLEGQQAVNSSDFSIAQFRYLEELLLIHGRWNFARMSKVVLFSFYKNAVLATILVVYAGTNLYSGTPLYDQWVVSMFNFLASMPILFTGLFDRDVDKDHVRKNPYLYASGPHNEELSLRKVCRWVFITFVHVFTIYYLSVPVLSFGGTATSAWGGLMRNKNREIPGNGEGDLRTMGQAVYGVMILTLAYKVLYETRTIINGMWPPFTCRNEPGSENWGSRLSWTWIGIFPWSLLFFVWAIYLYSYVAETGGNPEFASFIGIAYHLFQTRALIWMVFLYVPITATVFDVAFKVFSDMYYPTQTQIHMEIAAMERANKEKQKKKENHTPETPPDDLNDHNALAPRSNVDKSV